MNVSRRKLLGGAGLMAGIPLLSKLVKGYDLPEDSPEEPGKKPPLLVKLGLSYPHHTLVADRKDRIVKYITSLDLRFGTPSVVTLQLVDLRNPEDGSFDYGFLPNPEKCFSYWYFSLEDGQVILRDQDGIVDGPQVVGRIEDGDHVGSRWIVQCACDCELPADMPKLGLTMAQGAV